MNVVCNLFMMMDASESYFVLLKMKKYWNELPKKGKELTSWYYAICQLVRNISQDALIKEKFQSEYSDFVYIDRTTADRKKNKLIYDARQWYTQAPYGMLVNPIFRLIGARSILDDYQSQLLMHYDTPTADEHEKIILLFSVAEIIMPWKCYEDLPIVCIENDNAKKATLPLLERRYGKKTKTIHYHYILKKIFLRHADFEPSVFYETLLKFCEILLQAYGGAKSNRVNVLLTELGVVFIEHKAVLAHCAEVWDAGR